MAIARFLSPILILLTASAAAQLRLNITAVGAENGVSTIECWEMDSPSYLHDNSDVAGTEATHLGNVSTMSWAVSPPGQYVAGHNAPTNQ